MLVPRPKYRLTIGVFICFVCTSFPPPLKHSNNTDLRVFVSLNLAITFMKIGEGKDTEVCADVTEGYILTLT